MFMLLNMITVIHMYVGPFCILIPLHTYHLYTPEILLSFPSSLKCSKTLSSHFTGVHPLTTIIPTLFLYIFSCLLILFHSCEVTKQLNVLYLTIYSTPQFTLQLTGDDQTHSLTRLRCVFFNSSMEIKHDFVLPWIKYASQV